MFYQPTIVFIGAAKNKPKNKKISGMLPYHHLNRKKF
jgi:hypothetical protein